ncbi:ddo-2, partial [Pristionchus pacificus]
RYSMSLPVAIVGEGVIGLSTALALLEAVPRVKITIFSDRPIEKICSFGPAGLFRIDNPKYRDIGRISFERFSHLYRTRSGDETGIKLLSGTIMSDDKSKLEGQEQAYGDTVYNFRWLGEREKKDLFPNPAKHAIFFTTFASEANRYMPFLRKEIGKYDQVEWKSAKIEKLEQLGDQFDVVVNCGGLDAGKLAGDDDTMYPIRGVALRIEAPWHKHFYYKDLDTFTIPMNDAVTLGSLKQKGRSDMTITDEDRRDIWERYEKIHPAIKGSKVLYEWIALRPGRDEIRLESQNRKSNNGKEFMVVHNYGHASNGFTLGWGCAHKVVAIIHKEKGIAKL